MARPRRRVRVLLAACAGTAAAAAPAASQSLTGAARASGLASTVDLTPVAAAAAAMLIGLVLERLFRG